MFLSKSVLDWSSWEIFVDGRKSLNFQYFRGWEEKADMKIFGRCFCQAYV